MLHDPSHVDQTPIAQEILLSPEDKGILRQLGTEIAEISALDCHGKTAKLWCQMNDLAGQRPMLWINELPWHELNATGELTLKTSHPWARSLETELRRTLYQWHHLRGDIVINPYLECKKIYHSTDFGLVESVDTRHTDSENEIYSRHFIPQISEPEDIFKIKMPKITYLEQATQYSYEAMEDLFRGIIPVKLTGQSHIWYTPWDYLIRWWGIEEAMVDLYLRPEMVHDAYERMVDAWMIELDQFDQLGLLELDNNNTRIGSGGYGYVSSLPGKDFDGIVHPHNMWGCANAQIFSEVSPQMHWDFAVAHDLRWLSRFGLTYYGCCEPLHNKMGVLEKIPNLRKVSVSAWANIAQMAEACKNKYVMSIKPSPAIFVGDWDIDLGEKQLREDLDKARGCNVEIIMKDISTLGYCPEKIWEWAQMAHRVIQE